MADQESYWVKREQENIKLEQLKDEKVIARLHEIIDIAQQEILKEIDAFYGRYAEKNKITPAEAKKQVAEFDAQAFGKTAARYVREKNFSDEANKELYTYNTKMRISRQELLMMYLNAHLVAMADAQVKTFQEYLEQAGIDEVLRQAGLLGVNMTISRPTLLSLVNASFYNATWSERIWGDMAALREELSVIVNNAIVRGVHPERGVSRLRERFDVSKFEARRLLITETARVQVGAQELSYKAMDAEMEEDAEYRYISVMDGKTSKTCRRLNDKVYKVKDMQVGVNAPPMHVFCRSSTAFDLGDWRTKFFVEREGKYTL